MTLEEFLNEAEEDHVNGWIGQKQVIKLIAIIRKQDEALRYICATDKGDMWETAEHCLSDIEAILEGSANG